MNTALEGTTSASISGDFWVDVDGEGRSVSIAADLNSAGDTEVMIASGLAYVEEITLGDDWFVHYPVIDEWARGTVAAMDLGPASLSWPLRWTLYLESPTSVTYLGDSTIEGVECARYRVDVEESKVVDGIVDALAEAGATLTEDERVGLRRLYRDAEITIDVWIGAADHLPHKEQVDILVDARGTTKITGALEFTDFNEPTKIVSPSGYMALAEAEYALAGDAPETYSVCQYNIDCLEAEVGWYETLHGARPNSLDEVLAELPTCVSLGEYSLDPEHGDVVCSVHGRYRK